MESEKLFDAIRERQKSMEGEAEEAADDAYCLHLYADYQTDVGKGNSISIKEFAKDLSISL